MPIYPNFQRQVVQGMSLKRGKFFQIAVVTLVLAGTACSSLSNKEPQWAAANKKVIDESKVTGRTRELPSVTLPMVLGDGEPVEASKLPSGQIAPGVNATLWWGRG